MKKVTIMVITIVAVLSGACASDNKSSSKEWTSEQKSEFRKAVQMFAGDSLSPAIQDCIVETTTSTYSYEEAVGMDEEEAFRQGVPIGMECAIKHSPGEVS